MTHQRIMENIQDVMEENTPNTMQLQNLPAEILARIFMHLDYRERIRLESVCPTWRASVRDCAWRELRILRFSREMLHLDEPWKNKKRINSMIDELNSQQSEVTAKLVRDYKLYHMKCYGREEENCEDCPVKTNAGKNLDKYKERLKGKQRIAMHEYWKMLTDPTLYKRKRPTKQLTQLKAILHRCAPFLDELHLLGAFDIQMRFGHIFSQLAHPLGRLAHLHIHVPLDSWHLHEIQQHLAPQLLSLAVVPIENKNNKALVAFRELLANCYKLENLLIAANNYYRNLFDVHIGKRENGQPSSSSLAPANLSCCSFMPSTLKFLLVYESHWYYENPKKLVNEFLSLLAHCTQLRYMPILLEDHDLLKLIEEKNTRQFDKLIRLQFPFFIANYLSFQYIQRPEFRSLKAIHVDFKIGAEEIRQIAICCPQLEHLSIHLSCCADWNGVANIPDLLALHQFQRLSSLGIFMEFGYYDNFHEMRCVGGEQADIAFLEILTELDQIHPLRSLDFPALSERCDPSLSQDYLLQMAKQLKHLETFSCGFYLKSVDIDDMTGIGHFCAQLEEIFDSQEGANTKSFKFALLDNPNKWDYTRRRERKNLLVEWQKGSGTKRSKMDWHIVPYNWREHTWHWYFQPTRSIVLNELITSEFGQRTSSMLFDSFGMMENVY